MEYIQTQTKCIGCYFWIGLYRDQHDVWRWTDNTIAYKDEIDWYSDGYPVDVTSWNCAYLHVDEGHNDGKIFNYLCSSGGHVLCEEKCNLNA